MSHLRDAVVVLTGATGGLGRALVPKFLDAGAHLVVSGRNANALQELLSGVGESARHRIRAVPLDLTDAKAPRALRDAAIDWHGQIDGLVQAAGYNECNAFADEPDQVFQQILQVNLTAPAALMKAVLPDMLARGRGVILNVSSIMGLLGYPQAPGYTAAKFGLVGLTHALHQEVLGRGIRVHVVCPPGFETPMYRSVKNRPHYYDTLHPLRPEDVARAVLAAYGSKRCLHVIGLASRLSVGLHALMPELTNSLIRRVIGY